MDLRTSPTPKAFIWQGNPRKWHGHGTMDSYVAHKSKYIYWATPHLRDQIRPGDRAYIWRSLGEGPRGIIAIGTVAELPCEYTSKNASQSKHPDRLWIGEEAASSTWKTGISLSEVRLRVQTGMVTAEKLSVVCPTLGILRMPRQTIFAIDPEQSEKVDALWADARV
jgi:hypothetical protein